MSNRFDKAVKKAQTASNKNQDQIKNKNRKKLDSELCNILKIIDTEYPKAALGKYPLGMRA